MKKEILFLAALASCLSSFGQTFEKTAQGGKFQTAQPTLNGEVIFYSPSIVRIVKYPSAEMPEKKSYPVIKTPEKVEISYKQNGNTVSMTSGQIAEDGITVCVIFATRACSPAMAAEFCSQQHFAAAAT